MSLSRFPATQAYLDGLPAGLDSYPELEVHTDGLGDVRDIIPGPFDDLPGRLGAYFRREIGNTWVPEVLGQCTTLMIVDTHGVDYLVDRSRELAEKLYEGPVLRHLVKILSPTLILMGTQRRWGAIRHGTQMTSEPVQENDGLLSCRVRVTSPHPVFTEPFARALRPFLELAIESARGKEARAELAAATPTEMTYEGSWRR